MWLVRPAQPDDLEQILEIAGTQSARLSSTLPKHSEALASKIEHSLASFAGTVPASEAPRFLFVLEDTNTGQVAGTAGIDARAGNGQPFYNYRRDALVHASHELGVSRRVEVLYPSHSLTDQTLLCSFSIRPELRETEAFELLSRARMLFIAEHREWFSSRLVVEIQGVQDEDGSVPFWDSLARHFFNMDFETADQYSSMLSKTFIAELMPPNPVYVTLLTERAQAALGQCHPLTKPNLELLLREGFHAGCYLDIFDAGPVLEARTDTVHTLVTSHRKSLHGRQDEAGDLCLISAGEGQAFRCTLARAEETLDDELKLSVSAWKVLGKSAGDAVRMAPL
ncbi:arginine N-succinyltransferase [Marinobacter alexandrii]|jgi:arginine N-succinyltransferase|uniref:arginine N-succinyltransferase n=2 Tax=Marinobacter alexandrii TaxID=2570351 RepID=UPI001FFE7A98|nr:arginine N-succinyltransferase [Marinobacter alexandrii]MCK2150631.1 arginine N-succinyltransferase [Marinobacter alexandrii]